MAGIIVVDRIESDASYASSINVASPLVISNTISVTNGTITGNLNIDNGTLFVNQNNNRVGIGGITNPADFLDVNTSIAITENGVANSNTFLTLYSRFSDSQRGYVFLKAESNSSGSSDLVIRSRNNFSEAEKFRIDSVGRVTQPFQPAFSGGLVGGSGNVTANPLVFNSALLNQGSCYNTSNGLFTCPVAGVYRVSCSTTTFINGYAAVNISLRKNGSDIDVAYGKGYWEGSLSTSYLGKTASWLISCAANDNLAVGGTVYREPSASYCTLTIELVG
jgi:hypothetical protein